MKTNTLPFFNENAAIKIIFQYFGRDDLLLCSVLINNIPVQNIKVYSRNYDFFVVLLIIVCSILYYKSWRYFLKETEEIGAIYNINKGLKQHFEEIPEQ